MRYSEIQIPPHTPTNVSSPEIRDEVKQQLQMWAPSWLTACVAIGNFSSIFYCKPMLQLPGLTSSAGNSNSLPPANPKQSHSGRKKFFFLVSFWPDIRCLYVNIYIYACISPWSWCQIPAMHHRLHNAVCVHSHVKAGESAEISDKFLPVRRWFTGQLDASAGEFVHERMCRHVKCVKVPVVIFHLSD